MKWFVLLIIIAAAVWLYVDTDTRQKWLGNTVLAPAAGVTTVYKWRDEQGNWQITDEPPAGGVDYERLQYASDTNVMPLVPDDEKD